jgi:nucleoside-diphosphate-sugar epimerase
VDFARGAVNPAAIVIMPRVLVTGVAGFIGSHVADHCLRLGFDVVGVDNLSGGFWRNLPAAAHFVAGDVSSPDVVAQLWREHGPFDYVYHLAAYAAEGLSHHIRRFNYQHNLLATANLINADLSFANLGGATLTNARLSSIRCNTSTRWPSGFTPPTCAP